MKSNYWEKNSACDTNKSCYTILNYTWVHQRAIWPTFVH